MADSTLVSHAEAMPARRLYHSNTPPWTLACAAIFAALGAATTAPSISPTGLDYGPTISLQYTNRENITTLVPLTQGATESNVSPEPLPRLAHVACRRTMRHCDTNG